MSLRLCVLIIFTISLTACATSDDPRKGGLFGGISGLNSGAYDKRVQDREVELGRQQDINRDLKDKSKTLEREASTLETELEAERQKMAKLEDDLSTMEANVSRLTAKSAKQKTEIANLKRKIEELKRKLKIQQTALDELDRSGGAADPERYKVLQKERDRLADEYKKLLKYSKALSDAAK